jgi:plasmid stabilization system protein ParE
MPTGLKHSARILILLPNAVPRDDIRPGLRVVGFERRATIAFRVEDDRVTILRIFHGGRDWQGSF